MLKLFLENNKRFSFLGEKFLIKNSVKGGVFYLIIRFFNSPEKKNFFGKIKRRLFELGEAKIKKPSSKMANEFYRDLPQIEFLL